MFQLMCDSILRKNQRMKNDILFLLLAIESVLFAVVLIIFLFEFMEEYLCYLM